MDTLGWDTVFAICLDQVNALLKANAARLPLRLSGASDATSSLPYRLEAVCDAWQLEPRSSGALFNLIVPLVSGQLCAAGGAAMDIGGTTVAIEIDLRWLPAQIPGGHEVAFDFPAPEAAKAGEIRAGGEHLGTAERALLPFVISRYLAGHADAITYVLATVNPAAPGASWVSPESSAFTILQDAGTGRAFLTILSCVDGRDVSVLSRAVPLTLPKSADEVFVLSQEMVLSRIVLPAIAAAFGASGSNLKLSPTTHAIESVSSFGIGGVKSGLITYYPRVRALRSAIDGGALVTSVHGDCDMKMNIVLSFAVETRCPLAFDEAKQTISFARDLAPVKRKDVRIPWYAWLMGPLADLIMAIVVNVIADDLGAKINSAIASTSSLQQLTSVVAWTGLNPPRLTSARLESALVLTGSFQ